MSTTPQNAKLLKKLRRRATAWVTTWVTIVVGLIGLHDTFTTLQAAPLDASSGMVVALTTNLITASVAGLATLGMIRAVFRYVSALNFSKQ